MSTNGNDGTMFKSELLKLKDFAKPEYTFNIPIYQRLYVWKEEQVQKLIEDLLTHFEGGATAPYFLGSIVAVKNGNSYDLIDGQQRFTTLWLILKSLGDTTFASADRLKFPIRPHVTEYFKLASSNTESKNELDKTPTEHHSELLNIITAQKIIDNHREELTKIEDHLLLNNVKLIFTTVPHKVDLNKLFEAFNSGGVQLQQHELLKAQLLRHLQGDNERHVYEKMWTACSWMDTYIEDGLASVSQRAKNELCKNDKLWVKDRNKDTESTESVTQVLLNVDNVKNYLQPLPLIDDKTEKDTTDSLTNTSCLSHILSIKSGDETTKTDLAVDVENANSKGRSIIDFPLFLLHCLRIYQANQRNQADQADRHDIEYSKGHSGIDDKKLLATFEHTFLNGLKDETTEEKRAKKVKELIETIWQTRVLFDAWVIKWVKKSETDTDEFQSILDISSTTSKDSTYLIRTAEKPEPNIKALSVLQSMLYHTQESRTHYWLTPFLQYLFNKQTKLKLSPHENAFDYLRTMDNHLFFPETGGNLSERTWWLLSNFPSESTGNLGFIKKLEPNEEDNGDYKRFKQYLFYKIDFVLWFQEAISDTSSENEKNYYAFLMRRRNSVEHIISQTENIANENLDDWNGQYMHSLGNLGLVSVSENSSYSNNGFAQKKAAFNDKKERFNQPKLRHIYENDTWTDTLAAAHVEFIYKRLEDYLANRQSEITTKQV